MRTAHASGAASPFSVDGRRRPGAPLRGVTRPTRAVAVRPRRPAVAVPAAVARPPVGDAGRSRGCRRPPPACRRRRGRRRPPLSLAAALVAVVVALRRLSFGGVRDVDGVEVGRGLARPARRSSRPARSGRGPRRRRPCRGSTPPMVMFSILRLCAGRRPRPRRTCSACSRRTRRRSARPSYRSCPRCRGPESPASLPVPSSTTPLQQGVDRVRGLLGHRARAGRLRHLQRLLPPRVGDRLDGDRRAVHAAVGEGRRTRSPWSAATSPGCRARSTGTCVQLARRRPARRPSSSAISITGQMPMSLISCTK